MSKNSIDYSELHGLRITEVWLREKRDDPKIETTWTVIKARIQSLENK
jgi:hypothetical protein